MTFYHSTTREAAVDILANGFDMDAKRRRDPGDFGWGVYLTEDLTRAENFGESILEVCIDKSRFAYLECPYFLEGFDPVEPKTEVEKLFHGLAFGPDPEEALRRGSQERGEVRMLTCVCGQEVRIALCKRIRETFMAHGYAGIITPYSGGETVVFDTGAIIKVVLL